MEHEGVVLSESKELKIPEDLVLAKGLKRLYIGVQGYHLPWNLVEGWMGNVLVELDFRDENNKMHGSNIVRHDSIFNFLISSRKILKRIRSDHLSSIESSSKIQLHDQPFPELKTLKLVSMSSSFYDIFSTIDSPVLNELSICTSSYGEFQSRAQFGFDCLFNLMKRYKSSLNSLEYFCQDGEGPTFPNISSNFILFNLENSAKTNGT